MAIFQTTITFSQLSNLSVLTISSELKENANVVIRNHDLEITIKAIDRMVVRTKRTVTVLTKLGNDHVDLYAHYDNNTKITKLSAKIYDAFGKEIKKFSKGKFLDISAVDEGTLYSDSRVKLVRYTPISYPYTVVFESEYKTTTTGFIRGWLPVDNYFVAVQYSKYTLNNEAGIPLRTKETNFDGFTINNTSSGNNISYSLKNQPAIKYENSAVSYLKILPKLKVAADKFHLKGVYGEAKNWDEFGKWMYEKLLKGRDVVSLKTQNEIKSLVEGIDNPIERAKKVYQYVQDKTRYISVQVGIGGWEPIEALQVDKVGYGDCKGLTNYTKALLNIANVESYYTVVYADAKRDIDKEFSSIEGDHIILNIPNEGKDLWLECTSQVMPFGFLGDFTEDRNVLVITPEKGIIKRTPAYLNETNLQTLTANVTLDAEGNVNGTIERISKGIQYYKKFRYETFSQDDLIKHYKSNDWDYNNNFEIESIKLENDKKNVVFTENLAVSMKSYAAINQGEYLFRVNMFNRNNYVPKRYRVRKLPLKISRGYLDKDELTIKIPEGFTLDFIPEAKKLESKFGTYHITFEKVDNATLKYHKEILIKAGTYTKEDYKTYRKFRRSIAKYENTRIALTKKQ